MSLRLRLVKTALTRLVWITLFNHVSCTGRGKKKAQDPSAVVSDLCNKHCQAWVVNGGRSEWMLVRLYRCGTLLVAETDSGMRQWLWNVSAWMKTTLSELTSVRFRPAEIKASLTEQVEFWSRLEQIKQQTQRYKEKNGNYIWLLKKSMCRTIEKP